MEDTYILVNGVKMSVKDYKKSKQELKPTNKTRKRKKKPTEIKLLSDDIKLMLKKVKFIKSLSAYHDNAYRQWGVVAKKFIECKDIEGPFILYKCKARTVVNTIHDINELGKRNSKHIFQLIEKLSYDLDDLKSYIDMLCHNIVKSGYLQHFNDYEFISGEGRRLGIKTLISRSTMAIHDINNIIKECQKIALKGVDSY